jgi:fumarate reductase flavoprotein subunit
MYRADDATTWHLHADLVVVGSSGGGLVGAIAAAREGCRVVVLERAKELGGGLSRSRGMIPAAGTRLQRLAGVQDEPEAFVNDILAHNHHTSDPAYTLALCRAAKDLVEWLVDSDVTRLEFVPTLIERSHVTPRLHVHAAGSGAAIVADLVRSATKDSRVTIRAGSVVEDFWADETGTVVGVAAREKRGPINIRAGRVLLACGGFAANNDLVAEHHKDHAAIPYVGNPGALGDGLRWGTASGAATEHLGSCWVTAFATAPGGMVVPDALIRDGAIIVNQAGERFVNETTDPSELVQTILAQPGRLAYLIFDERIYRATREVDPYFARLLVPRAVRRDANPADLARHFEIEADNFIPIVENFHAGIVHRTDPFGRSEAGAPFSPPFFGVRIGAARMRTLGGLRVNDSAQVLRSNGVPIPNLCASGGVVADIAAGGATAYPIGSEVLMSLVLGWLAGRTTRPQETT